MQRYLRKDMIPQEKEAAIPVVKAQVLGSVLPTCGILDAVSEIAVVLNRGKPNHGITRFKNIILAA